MTKNKSVSIEFTLGLSKEQIQERIDYFESKIEIIEEKLEWNDFNLMEKDKFGLTNLNEYTVKRSLKNEAYLQYCQRRLKYYEEKK